ncbi:condensation domain-containing protein, partial [Streptomyces sp. ms184]|uniref:condensation domain-containing protein n=1 Tax=Streptomyces sp. ms184 TaxID=1827974 RepID=UPI00211D56B5
VSGRTPEVPGVESMIGLFINTVPVRVRMDAGDTWADLAARVQAEQADLLPHQHESLTSTQRAAGPGSLFDTVVAFENYLADRTAQSVDDATGLRVTGATGYDGAHYPLNLIVVPGPQLRLRLDYRTDRFDRDAVVAVADRLVRLLVSVAGDADRRV